MKRRDFTARVTGLASLTGLGLAGGTWLASGAAMAQGAFTEGKDYVRLSAPAPVAAGGKIDVVEFFWYGCPHCNTFDPMLEAWSKRLPADVAFRRVPVTFSALHETHAKLFYALEAVGQLESTHRKVFAAMHVRRKRLDKEADIEAFATEVGLDSAKLMDAFKSFGVAAKVRQGRQLSDAYKIDGVPTMGVHGRWFTSPALVGGNERALPVVDFLIQRARKPS